MEDPMLRLSLFRNRLFAAGTLAIFLNSLARGCVLLVLVFYLQGPNMNLGPLEAGVFLLPNTITIAVFGPLAGYLSDKRGPRLVATVGLVTSAIGLLLLTQLPSAVTFWQLAFPLALVGTGMGIFAPPNRSSVMSSVAPEDRGIAAGISTTLINLGNSVSRSVAFVLSDFFTTGYERALSLASARHDVIPLMLVDPRDEEMPDVGLAAFEDFETGEEILVDTSSKRVRAHYAHTMRETRNGHLKTFNPIEERVRVFFDQSAQSAS